jgi:hypothetical protein
MMMMVMMVIFCIRSAMNSFTEGQNTEQLFAHMASKRGWNVIPATKNENIHHHIDYFLKKDNHTISVDVKSQKRESRRLLQQEDWHVIEFVGVTYPMSNLVNFSKTSFNPQSPDFSLGSGRKGWIYGDAEFIVFELIRSFIFVNRNELLAYCSTAITFSPLTTTAQQAKYRAYSRANRGDLLSYVNKKDLCHLSSEKWHKPIVLQ